MYKFNQIFKTDLLNLVTNPMWLFYCAGFPFLLVLIVGFLTSGGYGEAVTSYDYYGITMLIFIAFNTATISANSFMEERIKSGNLRIIHSPIRPFYIHFSKLLATFVFAAACHLIVGLILHFLVGVNYGGVNTGYVIVLLLLAEFFASGLGVMMCCAFKSEGITNQILSMAITLLAVLGGLFFPLDGLGAVIARLSDISPVKWMVKAVFQIVYDHDFTLFLPACVLLILLGTLNVLLSVKFMKTEDYV